MSEVPILRIYDWIFPPRVVFGLNTSKKVGEYARSLTQGKKAVIVTDKVLSKLEFMKDVESSLKEKDFEVTMYTEIETEPVEETVVRITNFVREFKPDIVIGIGGGSVLDMAKTASVMVTNPGDPLEYFGAPLMPAKRSIEKPGIPKILIPTTAGTGSEITQYAVIISADRRTKKVLTSKYAVADIAIVDPMLTVTLPPKLTAGTGLDALSHAIEAYMSLWSTPLTDAISLEASRLIFKYLRRAYYNGSDIEARYYMSLAALMAAIPLINAKVLLGHSIAQTIGPRYNIPHGIACGMSLPYAMKYNLPVITEKLARLAEYVGLKVEGLSLEEKAKVMIKAVAELVEELGISLALRDYGIPKEDIPSIVDDIMKFQPRPNNPRKFTKESLEKLLTDMWEGKVL